MKDQTMVSANGSEVNTGSGHPFPILGDPALHSGTEEKHGIDYGSHARYRFAEE
jgi:hypothetical protein